MDSARIILFIAGLCVITLTSCNNDKSSVPPVTCKILRQAGDCSSVPTLNTGELKIKSNGSFSLEGQYQACYHKEAVSIQGQYQASSFSNGFNIELLATKIKGLGSSDFPATIAVVTLDKSSLKGVINDIWATIRTPIQNAKKRTIDIICVAN